MDKDKDSDDKSSLNKKKDQKCNKNEHLKIDETQTIQPNEIPKGSQFKGYRERIIQDIIFKTQTTYYRLAEYVIPEGQTISGELPDDIQGSSFGKNLVVFILYQYHHQPVTQPLLLEQIHDLGIDISNGKLSEFLTQDLDDFHTEKESILFA